MSFLSHAAAAAFGYLVSEVSDSHPIRDFINEKYDKKKLKESEDEFGDKLRAILDEKGIPHD